METNQLDKILENSIKNVYMEVNVQHPVMERIETYEITKAKRPGIVVVLIYIYTFITSLVSLGFFHQLGGHFKTILQKLPVNLSALKLISQGIFIAILIVLLLIVLYFRPRRKSTDSTSFIR
jgi:hypothetical protein